MTLTPEEADQLDPSLSVPQSKAVDDARDEPAPQRAASRVH